MRLLPDAFVAVALLAGALASCRAPVDRGPTVFAASSLSGVLDPAAARWSEAGHPPPRFTFDATSRLARQIEDGAPADIVVSADVAWMDVLVEHGRVDPATRRDLLSNRMVLVVPAHQRCPAQFAGLDEPRFVRIGVGGETVPVGRYARQVLASAGKLDALSPRLVPLPSARALLTAVDSGELDAALLYQTDARRGHALTICTVFEGAEAPVILYQAAVTVDVHDRAEATSLLDHLGGNEAWVGYEGLGFVRP